MRQRGRPFAFAVWTYACPSSSIIDERAIIVSLPTAGSASVSAGRMRCSMPPRPGRGQELELDREEQDQEDAQEELRHLEKPDEARGTR